MTGVAHTGLMEPSAMTTEYLEAELVAHAAWETAGLARMLQVLAEFDDRRGWALWECRSAQQWLSWKCGLGYTAATERLRVAHALPGFPMMAARFAQGRLSWSKVRELTRVAIPGKEQGWCDLAEYLTASQLARLTSAARTVTGRDAAKQIEQRGLSWSTRDDGLVDITLRVPAEQAMAVINTVRSATTPELGVRWAQSAADTLVELVMGDRDVKTEVIVHVTDGHAHLEDGLAIAMEVAECMACDGDVTTVVDTGDGPVEIDKRRAPTKRQRKRLRLKHPMCQFTGCHHAGKFDAHHVVERGKGGRTALSNLVRLCWFHHRMVHLHALLLTLHPDRTLTVTTSDGTPIDRPIPKLTFDVDRPVDPDLIGQWQGDRMHINDCLYAAGIR